MSETFEKVEQGLQLLQQRRQRLGIDPQITRRDRDRIAQQQQLAREPWALTRTMLADDPELVRLLDDLWPEILPHLIQGNEISPIHHIPNVVWFMVQICLKEVTRQEMKRGVIAALLHDIGIGACGLPKISEASIQRANPVDKVRLRRDGIASRLEHMKRGVEISGRLLQAHVQSHPGSLTEEDIDAILQIIGSHDYSKIPLMEDRVDRKWLLSPGREDWLKQCHWEADALWMLSPAGILVDLERENEEDTPAHRKAKFLFNLSLHRDIVTLYGKAYSPEEMKRFGFHDGLLYRSETGYQIAREFMTLWGA